jgi:predicted transglutaminase-like cysteine proteinase
MNTDKRVTRRVGAAALISAAMLAGLGAVHAATDDAPLYVEASEVAQAPLGWVEFCASNPGECATTSPGGGGSCSRLEQCRG